MPKDESSPNQYPTQATTPWQQADSDSYPEGSEETAPPMVIKSTGERPPTSTSKSESRYAIVGELARGGMGVVYQGHDHDLDRRLAVKVLREELRTNPQAVQRFYAEAQIGGQLQHPGIVPVYDLGLSEEQPYFTMKLVEGETLAKLLGQRPSPSFELSRLLKVFEQICQTLAYAHAQGIIHRDLKPHNIMVGAFGEVQVMDWGLAKSLKHDLNLSGPSVDSTARDQMLSQPGMAMGTPAYMAPEQARGEIEQINERADVYGLGAILYQILTGKAPNRQSKTELLTVDFALLESCGADKELISLTKDCLNEDLQFRPPHAGSVAESMSDYLASVQQRLHEAELAQAASQAKAAEERKARRLTMTLAAVTILFLAIGSFFWITTSQRQADEQLQLSQSIVEALKDAEVLRAKAQGAPEENVAIWEQTREAVRRAEDLLTTGEVKAGLRGQVQNMVTHVEQGLHSARARKKSIQMRMTFLGRLDQLRGNRALAVAAIHDEKDILKEYAEAFQKIGVDLENDPLSTIAAILQRMNAAVDIAASLDDLARYRRALYPKDLKQWQRLYQLAILVDPDANRKAIRKALLTDEMDSLRKLAQKDLTHLSARTAYVLARALQTTKQMKLAITVLSTAVQQTPNDFWLNYQLGYSLSDDHPPQLQEALRYYTAALSLKPDSPVAQHSLANTLAKSNRIDQAIIAYERALDLQVNFPGVYYNLGLAYQKKKEWIKAIECFQKGQKLKPHWTVFHRGLGNLFLNQGYFEKAKEAFQQVLKLNPRDPYALYGMGKIHSERQEIEQAIDYFEKTVQQSPNRPEYWQALAIGYASKKVWKKAESAIQQALSLSSRSAQDLNVLAYIYSLQQQWEKVEAVTQEAVQADPLNAQAFTRLGESLHNQGKVDKAIDAYRRCIDLKPDGITLCNLGAALETKGENEDAENAYRRALSLNSSLSLAHRKLGYLLKKEEQWSAAALHLRKACQGYPSDDKMHLAFSAVLVKLEEWAEAEKIIRQTIQLVPAKATHRRNLAYVLIQQKQYQQAITAYQQAIQLQPDDLKSYRSIGKQWSRLGQYGKALDAYRKGKASANIIKVIETFADIEKRLPALLAGKEKPKQPQEWIAVAEVCQGKQKYVDAARFFKQGFVNEAEANSTILKDGHRRPAAESAILAANGQGIGTEALSLDDKQQWRQQALTWLQEEVAHWKQRKSESSSSRALAKGVMNDLLAKPNLRWVRDAKSLQQVPAKEADQWRKLWKDMKEITQ